MQVYAALTCFSFVLISSADHVPVLKKHSYFNISEDHVTLNEVGLRDIEVEAFKDAKVELLNIVRNPLEKLRKGIFVNVSIHEMYMTNNNISEIEPGTFQDLHPVEERGIYAIFLYSNNLGAIKKGVFTNTKFRKLVLRSNKITYIEPGSFDGMVHLFEINLGYNLLERIDVGVFQNLGIPKGWVALHFFDNRLNFVDPYAFENTTVYTLNLAHNYLLERLDVSYFKNTNIGSFITSYD